MADERETGNILARLARAESDLIKLGERTHRHSSLLTSVELNTEVLKKMVGRIEGTATEIDLSALEGRIVVLENLQNKSSYRLGVALGVAAVIGGIISRVLNIFL